MSDMYGWCSRCEQANRLDEWKARDQRCPSCGAESQYLWSWTQIRSTDPAYPETPEAGVRYERKAQGAH